MTERLVVVSMAAVMSLGIVGGLVARGPHATYAWDNRVWEYSGDGMVCRRPPPWRRGEGFTLAATVRTCLPFGDPQVQDTADECRPAA